MLVFLDKGDDLERLFRNCGPKKVPNVPQKPFQKIHKRLKKGKEIHRINITTASKGVGRKISRGGWGETKKIPKIALLSIFQGGGEATEKKYRKLAKNTENSTFKPLSTIFVACMKIQRSHAPLPSAAVAHGCQGWKSIVKYCSRDLRQIYIR